MKYLAPTSRERRTSADVQLDFSGGFPATGNGVNFGIVRLQTANMRLDWDNTTVVAGQDSLFISPLSPTSFASLATPAFAFAGNLWGWTPQIRIEHRFSLCDQQTITMQAGVFDNLDWESPSNSFYRSAQAGELSGQPAYALRTAWSRPVQEHPLSFGVAGYYGRQNWHGAVTSTPGQPWRTGRFQFFRGLRYPANSIEDAALGAWGSNRDIDRVRQEPHEPVHSYSRSSTRPEDGRN